MNVVIKSAVIGTMVTALAACAAAPNNVVSTPPDKGLVLFDTEAFDGTEPQRVSYINSWQEEEYARFEGDDARAEILYSVADERDSIVLDFDLTLASSIGTWPGLSSGTVLWGDKGSVRAPLGLFEYQFFTQTASNRSCVGFLNEWDHRVGDTRLRPAKVLFGYYCGKPGTRLGKDSVTGLLAGLWIKDNERIDYRFTPRLSLASAARPASNAAIDIRRFPFARADRFVDADGERDN